MIGITGYGTYIPKYRILTSEIAEMWGKEASEVVGGLKVAQKSVPGYDEDTATIAIEASNRALAIANIPATAIQALYIGSESHPYAVNPTASIVGEYLGIGNNYFAADLQFACKAGTAGMQIITALLKSNEISHGMAIGSDTAQGKPHDVLEYTAASAAAAYILSNKSEEVIAEVLEMSSFTSDVPSFWRRDTQKYPSHGGRFTGEPAYFHHVVSEAQKLFETTKLQPKDFAYCVFHMPNGKFPRVVAKKLGFSDEQIKPSLTVDYIGNPYSASSMVGLSAVLDIAKPDQKIFFVSYGSGDGSDGFVFQITKNIIAKQKKSITFASQIKDTVSLSYQQYLKQTHTLEL